MRQLILLVAALIGVGQAWELSDPVGLRATDTRELSGYGKDEKYSLCAAPVDGKNPHLLANLDKDGKVLIRWVPVKGEKFFATVDFKKGTFTLYGRVIPLGEKDLKKALTINLTFSKPVGYKECYCASEHFLGYDIKNPDYSLIEKKCDLKSYYERPKEAKHLLFCPFCQDGQCQKATKIKGAPEPVYKDWTFFRDVKGELSGEGLKLFREAIEKGFPDIDEYIKTCTPDITNQPLPQLHCSDYSNPLKGYGYGVNAKNQKCGFSSWFNCKEDLPRLGGHYVKVKVADINLELIPCPKTPAPTPHKTPKPTPCPKKRCKDVKVCVPCEYFPHDKKCGKDIDWGYDDHGDADWGYDDHGDADWGYDDHRDDADWGYDDHRDDADWLNDESG